VKPAEGWRVGQEEEVAECPRGKEWVHRREDILTRRRGDTEEEAEKKRVRQTQEFM
jgi:hypothetical protein